MMSKGKIKMKVIALLFFAAIGSHSVFASTEYRCQLAPMHCELDGRYGVWVTAESAKEAQASCLIEAKSRSAQFCKITHKENVTYGFNCTIAADGSCYKYSKKQLIPSIVAGSYKEAVNHCHNIAVAKGQPLCGVKSQGQMGISAECRLAQWNCASSHESDFSRVVISANSKLQAQDKCIAIADETARTYCSTAFAP
jgi:hypothetical protein